MLDEFKADWSDFISHLWTLLNDAYAKYEHNKIKCICNCKILTKF